MDAFERRSVIALATVYLFRMLGLFLIIPIISISAVDLNGANTALIGTAIGIYGLTQALLQIPMGMLSDNVGRKKIIIIGLILFALGSILCANANDIISLIVGRAVQGSGAIASTLMALLSDVTREQNRTKAMATVGISIGVSFMLSLVLGPWLYSLIGLSGLFYLSFISSLLGILLIIWMIPNITQHTFRRDTTPSLSALGRVLKNTQLGSMNVSVFLLHASLTALFICIPSFLIIQFDFPLLNHSWLYLLVMGLAFIGMIPLVIIAEAKGKMKQVMTAVMFLLSISIMLMAFIPSMVLFGVLLWVYFVAFNTLEATLPSVVSKLSPVGYRGTAMGVFSTHQFLGAFIGGVGGGWLLQSTSVETLFITVGAALFIWSLLLLNQPAPPTLTSLAFSLDSYNNEDIKELSLQLINIQGVEEMQLFADEKTAYLKINKQQLDRDDLLRVVPQITL
ncbi:MFS transporter [Marinomonas sp. 2405UD68-3]|uniref:MFS transporter n=1 Tax=Marinomonas sp. 2405UD68-3 TaxID=3391835 RepID=UPI0039C9898D